MNTRRNQRFVTLVHELDAIFKAMRRRDDKLQLNSVTRALFHLRGADHVRVAVAGHFSSGKSTLLNRSFNIDLLPTDDIPETGVPCHLVHGSERRLISTSRNGKTRRQKLSGEAVRRCVRRYDDRGRVNRASQSIKCVEIHLPEVPPDTTWIDLPGINDDSSINSDAMQQAIRSDILVWVFSSQCPMSLCEWEFIDTYLKQRPAASVVFVMNVFLGADHEKAWGQFAGRDQSRLDQLFQERCRPLGLSAELTFVAAPQLDPLSESDKQDRFGSAQFAATMSQLDKFAERARWEQLKLAVDQAVTKAEESAAAESRRFAEARQAWSNAAAAHETKLGAFSKVVQHSIVANLIEPYHRRLRRKVNQLFREVESGELTDDREFRRRLRRRHRRCVEKAALDSWIPRIRSASQAAGVKLVGVQQHVDKLKTLLDFDVYDEVPTHLDELPAQHGFFGGVTDAWEAAMTQLNHELKEAVQLAKRQAKRKSPRIAASVCNATSRSNTKQPSRHALRSWQSTVRRLRTLQRSTNATLRRI